MNACNNSIIQLLTLLDEPHDECINSTRGKNLFCEVFSVFQIEYYIYKQKKLSDCEKVIFHNKKILQTRLQTGQANRFRELVCK